MIPARPQVFEVIQSALRKEKNTQTNGIKTEQGGMAMDRNDLQITHSRNR